jgi:hypothetical protein
VAGGEGGIRTLVRLSPKHAFQACAIDHSATSPNQSDEGRTLAPPGQEGRVLPKAGPGHKGQQIASRLAPFSPDQRRPISTRTSTTTTARPTPPDG